MKYNPLSRVLSTLLSNLVVFIVSTDCALKGSISFFDLNKLSYTGVWNSEAPYEFCVVLSNKKREAALIFIDQFLVGYVMDLSIKITIPAVKLPAGEVKGKYAT